MFLSRHRETERSDGGKVLVLENTSSSGTGAAVQVTPDGPRPGW